MIFWLEFLRVLDDKYLFIVGVLVVFREVVEEMEEEFFVRVSGAVGGGLVLEVVGGLNGLGLEIKSYLLKR